MRYRLAVIFIFFLITSLFAYLLRDYLSHLLFVPISNLALFTWKILISLPEIFWWVLLILGLVVFVLKALNFSIERKPKHMKDRTHPPGLVSDWNRMIDQAKKGEYSRWLLARKVANLALAVLAYQYRLTVEQVKELIVAQELQMPEEIRVFLLHGIQSPSFQHFLEIEQEHQLKIENQSIELYIENILKYLETEIT